MQRHATHHPYVSLCMRSCLTNGNKEQHPRSLLLLISPNWRRAGKSCPVYPRPFFAFSVQFIANMALLIRIFFASLLAIQVGKGRYFTWLTHKILTIGALSLTIINNEKCQGLEKNWLCPDIVCDKLILCPIFGQQKKGRISWQIRF